MQYFAAQLQPNILQFNPIRKQPIVQQQPLLTGMNPKVKTHKTVKAVKPIFMLLFSYLLQQNTIVNIDRKLLNVYNTTNFSSNTMIYYP